MTLENKLLSSAIHHISNFEKIYEESYVDVNLDGSKRYHSKSQIELAIDKTAMLYHGILGLIATNMYKLIKYKSTMPKVSA